MRHETYELMIVPVNKMKRVAICVIAIVLLSLALWALHQSTLSLVQRATLIGKLHSDGEIPVHPQWISEREAIFIRYIRDGHRFEFTRLNADTGRLSPMRELNAKFTTYLNPHGEVSEDRDAGAFEATPLGFRLSPSRRRILMWTLTDRDGDGVVWRSVNFVTDLIGNCARRWDSPVPIKYTWLPMWLNEGDRLIDASKPDISAHQISIVDFEPRLSISNAGPMNMPPLYSGDTCIAYNSRLWSVATSGSNSPIKIAESSLVGKPSSHEYRLDPPSKGDLSEVRLAPDGKHVAWLFIDFNETTFSKLAHRLFAKIPETYFKRYTIWVSDLDGSHMREVGTEQHDHASGDEIGVESIAWVLGCKEISFNFNGALYTIPVNH